MGLIITMGVFLGDYLDSKLNNQTPWWTLFTFYVINFCFFLPCFKNNKKKCLKNIFGFFSFFYLILSSIDYLMPNFFELKELNI